MTNQQNHPTPIQWHPREVAMTWPEGSAVLFAWTDHTGDSYFDTCGWFRPDLLGSYYKRFTQFALIELPKEE